MRNKRVGWAVGVYARRLSELRKRAEAILREELEENTELGWMDEEGLCLEGEEQVRVEQLDPSQVGAWINGSRMDAVVVVASSLRGEFLG